MRKLSLSALVVLVLGVMALPVMAADDDNMFEWDGQVRGRWDINQNREVVSGDAKNENSFNFWPYRAMLGVTGNFSERVWGRVDLQAAGHFGDAYTSSAFQDTYFGDANSGQVALYQGFVVLDSETWDFTGGRRERTLGNELQIGNNSFYNGFVFDGVEGRGTYSTWEIGIFYDILNDPISSFPGASGTGNNKTWFAGFDFSIDVGKDNVIEAYYILLRDGMQIGTDEARGFAADVSTFGLKYTRPYTEDSTWDLSVELAGQTGEMGDDSLGATEKIDNEGTIFEGWFGWTFGDDTRHRVHVGYFLASGDDPDSDDNKSEAWIPLAPDPHANNRLGNLDLFAEEWGGEMSNVQDISLGYNFYGGKNHALLAVHSLTLAEEITIGTATEDSIGTEIDLVFDHAYTPNTKLEIGIAYLNAGDALYAVIPGFGLEAPDNVSRVWVQLDLNWGKGQSDWQ